MKVSHNHVLLIQICNNLMHMWHYVTNHLIISNDKDFNSETNEKLRVRDTNAIDVCVVVIAIVIAGVGIGTGCMVVTSHLEALALG